MFIYGSTKKYINTEHIGSIEWRSKNNFHAYAPDGTSLGEVFDPNDFILQIHPCQGYEIVYFSRDAEKKPDVFAEPIIAWGVTLTGNIIPVGADLDTPLTLRQLWGIRKEGSEEIRIPRGYMAKNMEDFIQCGIEYEENRSKD